MINSSEQNYWKVFSTKAAHKSSDLKSKSKSLIEKTISGQSSACKFDSKENSFDLKNKLKILNKHFSYKIPETTLPNKKKIHCKSNNFNINSKNNTGGPSVMITDANNNTSIRSKCAENPFGLKSIHDSFVGSMYEAWNIDQKMNRKKYRRSSMDEQNVSIVSQKNDLKLCGYLYKNFEKVKKKGRSLQFYG